MSVYLDGVCLRKYNVTEQVLEFLILLQPNSTDSIYLVLSFLTFKMSRFNEKISKVPPHSEILIIWNYY